MCYRCPMRTYVVGGAVRDLLLGLPGSERDMAFQPSGPEGLASFRKHYPQARQAGKSFPVFLVDGVQWAPLRGATIEQDLAARDLTINALALDEQGELHAHPQALEDLRNRVLRPASDQAMRQDPARVFRAARFAAQLPGFSPHPDLMAAMRQAAREGLLEGVAPERVGGELRKALASPRPGLFITVLNEADCLHPWFRELAGADAVPAGPAPFHNGSVLEHVAQVIDRLAQASPKAPLRTWMALAHDLGKTATDPALLPRHHGHEHRGQAMAREMGERLRLPGRDIQAGAAAARWHMTAGRYPELRPGTKVDLLTRLHALNLVQDLFALAAADGKEDHSAQALADLERILAVKLPEELRDLGAKSGQRLHELRCRALDRPISEISP